MFRRSTSNPPPRCRYTPKMGTTIITAGVAALVAFLFSILNEAIRDRRAFTRRWDKDLFDRVSSYLATTTSVVHLSSGSRNKADKNLASTIADTHQQLRVGCNQLLLIADPSVAEAALRVQRESYAVIKTSTGSSDPRPGELMPLDRLYAAIETLTEASRAQLRLQPIQRTRIRD